MTRKLLLYLVFSGVLVALSACGRSYFTAEREPWRREAEMACLKSGSVKESPMRVRVSAIEGPGMCGADFPIKVAALGESRVYGYADELRPPGTIPGAASQQPKWPIVESRPAPQAYEPRAYPAPRMVAPARQPGMPMSIAPPGLAPATAATGYDRPAATPPVTIHKRPSVFDPPGSPTATPEDEDEDELSSREPMAQPRGAYRPAYPPAQPVPLGKRPMTTASIGPVEIKPTATLACPIVSALDRWMMDAVQPASLRWFGQPVVEIKQISAYSCRGMNGQRGARISEHAFGNALDIAAFILADGHKITVKNGWRGTPEEQAFLHDVQGAACEQFTTVLAPGSNVFHYDHIHVDLMRRASGRIICQPGAIPGEVVAARARAKAGSYAKRGDPAYTGSISAAKKSVMKKAGAKKDAWPPLEEEDESVLEEIDADEPRGGPGED